MHGRPRGEARGRGQGTAEPGTQPQDQEHLLRRRQPDRAVRKGIPESKAFAARFRERVASLGRAHEFVRPHSEASQPKVGRTTVKGLLEALFSPYPAAAEGRLAVIGDDAPVDDRGATPVAMLFHELATNAIKYGALSSEAGRIDIAIAHDGETVTMRWVETGGPAVGGVPGRAGFGTKLAEMSVERQLGGRLTRDWRPEGLVVVATIEAARLARAETAPD